MYGAISTILYTSSWHTDNFTLSLTFKRWPFDMTMILEPALENYE
jgi:hypothetical protein